MFIEQSEFEGLTGVGRVQLMLEPNRHVYTFIGANGVGKTKTLEALFQVLFFSNPLVKNLSSPLVMVQFRFNKFTSMTSRKSITLDNSAGIGRLGILNLFSDLSNDLPVLFLGAQFRGSVVDKNPELKALGNLDNRREKYISSVINKMQHNFGSIGMDAGIEEWFVTLAQSSNPYQKKEDNRGFEIDTVVKILHQIDGRIDPNFLEISGNNRVSLRIEGQKRALSELSSGFASIVKLIQAIVSGYGYFTNEANIQHVKGTVLIDEIESHLHLSWQATIIPLLKTLFPNTTFYITTHSSIVLSQLQEGEAYKLYRDTDGVVKTSKIAAPNKAALADILKDVFNIDINQQKIESSHADQQADAKRQLLQLLNQQGDN